MNKLTIKFSISALIALSFILYPLSFPAQVRPVYDYGAIGLGQLLKRLQTTKSVMHIGAHPDDEDSALLAYLARGENARTAYLSLTRGDGGQNLIGEELFESLGVIRTEELLQARRLDGAEQFFTRAFDYGFSKTLDEAKQKWDEKIILCDAVRAIRAFRPLVVISRFSGTPADGHGQHQFAGYIAPLAVKAAADSNQCKDSGSTWQVLKFYVGQGFRSTGEPTLRINTGEYDFLLGRSYFEIAMEGRSQHKTQEQGVLELKGERFSGLNLIESKVPKVEKEKSVFDGIDTTITDAWISSEINLKGDLLDYLKDLQPALSDKIGKIDLSNPKPSIEVLLYGYKVISQLSGVNPQTNRFGIKREEFLQAIQVASGLQIDVLSSQEVVTPGESFLTNVKIYFPNDVNYKIRDIKLNSPVGWQVSKIEPPNDQNQSFFGREVSDQSAYFSVKVPMNAKPTQPFWLERQRNVDSFVWEHDENQNLPFQKPLMTAEITAELNGVEVNFSQPIQFRYADDIRGEIRRNLNVVPKISLSLDQNLLIVPKSEKAQTRRIALSITNNTSSPVAGEAKLNVPDGWRVTPVAANFNLKNKGEKTSAEFDIQIPANVKIGDFDVSGQAAASGEIFAKTMNVIAYPHIQTHRFYTDAKAKINVLNLKVAPVKVGYIMGGGDKIPEAIRHLGLNVTMLDEKELSTGDLNKYDVIVVGIRASQVRPDYVANNARLVEFMSKGGTLIVQYQQPEFIRYNLPPFPAKMTSNIRTTDENAPVKILAPDHPVFNFPNKITDADFAGWVQERNLYTLTEFDAKYTPLLETHDPGEPESKGGMLYAEVGRGKFIYTAYSWFRQLPTGNPGAYRIFANMLSLPKSGKQSDVK